MATIAIINASAFQTCEQDVNAVDKLFLLLFLLHTWVSLRLLHVLVHLCGLGVWHVGRHYYLRLALLRCRQAPSQWPDAGGAVPRANPRHAQPQLIHVHVSCFDSLATCHVVDASCQPSGRFPTQLLGPFSEVDGTGLVHDRQAVLQWPTSCVQPPKSGKKSQAVGTAARQERARNAKEPHRDE